MTKSKSLCCDCANRVPIYPKDGESAGQYDARLRAAQALNAVAMLAGIGGGSR